MLGWLIAVRGCHRGGKQGTRSRHDRNQFIRWFLAHVPAHKPGSLCAHARRLIVVPCVLASSSASFCMVFPILSCSVPRVIEIVRQPCQHGAEIFERFPGATGMDTSRSLRPGFTGTSRLRGTRGPGRSSSPYGEPAQAGACRYDAYFAIVVTFSQQ